MARPNKRGRIIIAAAILIALVIVLTRPSGSAYQPPIEHRGGEPMRVRLAPAPIHLQTDPRWKDETLGGSEEPFATTGCVVCGVSMALAEHGLRIPPDSLNTLLKSHAGYTRQGWLKWDAIADITDGAVWIDASAPLDHRTIDNALREGSPVLAKVMIDGTTPHWVLITGKEGLEYLMKDPLGDGSTLDTIGRYGSRIHAIRVVRSRQ